ncbi:sulfatase-like hydrolase/transferase [Nonomuraea sp. LP-02]|uniref:sulfatase-like hydrolase/transferase n=1 Tax=Nonomuraea sp. LP-02 TaxID=3097960 RepID=UPI002E301745|nr:sulfatase-like hydrolase/transferase [Nonomuraea sp. LP-02]MED7931889.1 sulfatase-like hydrolase/transferase [Nonomuraea sp. LP-02]
MIPAPSRRTLLAGALAGLSVRSAAASPAQAEVAPRPNFLIILADDLGWGEIGIQGQKKIATPAIDRLAAEGVRFETAYSGAPLCAPSRCSLLTGLHAGHATVRENPEGGPQRALIENDLTFAELLQLSGYRTACIGKWGFGPELPGQPSHPNERGFDEFFGYITHRHAHQYYPRYLWHNGGKVALSGRAYAPGLFLRRAVDFIKEPSDQPFLLYFPTILPHSPSVVPGDAGPYENKPWTRPNRRHAAQVTLLDSHVEQLVTTLRETGKAANTIVLFMSDNGPHREKGVTPGLFDSNGPLRADKRDLYEGGIRVPLIAWSPKLSSRVETRPVAYWDVLPTLADLAGVPAPDGIDGRSFRGMFDGGDGPDHHHLVWNRPRKAQAIRRGRWKAIRFAPGIAGAGPDGRIELYDLDTDLGERKDLSSDRPELVGELMELLDQSIGPDPRRPYGLRMTASGDRVTVTLVNGSAVTWRRVRLALDLPRGRKATARQEAAELAPGEKISATFRVPGRGAVTGSASFRTGSGRHTFRRTYNHQRSLV